MEGFANQATGNSATVSGGDSNQATGADATVGGGQSNRATATFATIGGGGPRDPGDEPPAIVPLTTTATVCGGANNQAGDNDGTSTMPNLPRWVVAVITPPEALARSLAGPKTLPASRARLAAGPATVPPAITPRSSAGSATSPAAAIPSSLAGITTSLAAILPRSAAGSATPQVEAGNHCRRWTDCREQRATGNRVTDDYGTIGGGGNNQAGDGAGTTTDRTYATVAAASSKPPAEPTAISPAGATTAPAARCHHRWQPNSSSNNYATVSGGYTNLASNLYATIRRRTQQYRQRPVRHRPGGYLNTASGTYATVAGGLSQHEPGRLQLRCRAPGKGHTGQLRLGRQHGRQYSSTAQPVHRSCQWWRPLLLQCGSDNGRLPACWRWCLVQPLRPKRRPTSLL